MNNFDRWCDVYKLQLANEIKNHPDYHRLDLEETFKRMKQAFAERSYNKDSGTIKNCCRFFKIAHTYSAINRFLSTKGE
jgi:hypothetical protein